MERFELSDGRKVSVPDRIDEHDDCAFCNGRASAHRGELLDRNPFELSTAAPKSVAWYESDYAMWIEGHNLGGREPGGLLWYEQPNFEAEE